MLFRSWLGLFFRLLGLLCFRSRLSLWLRSFGLGILLVVAATLARFCIFLALGALSAVFFFAIGTSAFENCTGLTGALVFADNAVVGNNAFKGCAGFTGDLDLSQVTVGEGTFENCTGLTGKLTLNAIATEVPASAFAGAGFTGELVIPESVKTIDRKSVV